MSRMGSSCSSQRQRAILNQDHRSNRHRKRLCRSRNNGNEGAYAYRSVRYSVDSEVPDHSIAAFYPVQDNYVTEANSSRSPKSLVDICTDAVCRSLPYLDGELPPGLPQDVVDDIVQSLMKHSALNATTLRALRNCELGTLSLAGCRGVTDDWLVPLSSIPSSSPSASSLLLPPFDLADKFDILQGMDLDHYGAQNVSPTSHDTSFTMPLEYRETIADESSSSCSISSFVSASSTPYVPASSDDAQSTNGDTHSMAALTAYYSPSATVPLLEDADITMHGPLYSDRLESQVLVSPLTSHLTLLDLRGSQRLTDKGLLQLRHLGSLEVAKLDGCHSIVGRGLLALGNSHRLHTLSLANCRRLTDEALINISHLSSIEALSLDGCRCLTDKSLVAISGLFGLRKLDLSQCDLVTNDGIEHLHELGFLEELSLGWCRSVTDLGIEILIEQPGRTTMLRVLRLARCPITDKGVSHIGNLKALEELDLNGCNNVSSTVLGDTLEKLNNLTSLDVSYCPNILRTSWQNKIKSLKSLELCYSGVRDQHLSLLQNLPALEELNLDSCPVGDWAISHLADNNAAPNLTSLDLADTDITDLGMVHLTKFQKLTRLSLFYCSISNLGLCHLATMTALQVLNLDSLEIGDDGLSHLHKLTNLVSLDVFSGRITDAGCAHISRIKSLESLELCGGGVGDLGCTLLANLENLTSLNLSQNERITNRGAAALAALSNLKTLNLSNTRVNSLALRFFGGLVNLQSLALYGCRGIEDGTGPALDDLQSELPRLKCLRLNTAAEGDGRINYDYIEDSDDVDEADDVLQAQRRARSDSASLGSTRDDSDGDFGDFSDAEEDYHIQAYNPVRAGSGHAAEGVNRDNEMDDGNSVELADDAPIGANNH